MTTKSNASSEMTLDQSALDAVRSSLDQGAITPAYGPHRDAIIKLLNGALATELVCAALQTPPLHGEWRFVPQDCRRVHGACQ